MQPVRRLYGRRPELPIRKHKTIQTPQEDDLKGSLDHFRKCLQQLATENRDDETQRVKGRDVIDLVLEKTVYRKRTQF